MNFKMILISGRSGLASYSTVSMLSILLACLTLTNSGCNRGPKLVEVKGSVVVDGKPAEGVNLIFFDPETKVAVASAQSGSEGKFEPVTDMNQGMPEGKYLVAATWPDPKHKAPKVSMGADAPSPPDLLKSRYLQSKSDVYLDVNASSLEPVIELKSK